MNATIDQLSIHEQLEIVRNEILAGIATADAATLAKYTTDLKTVKGYLSKGLDILNEAAAKVREETDRRQLAAFWEANPDLLRLEVGDKIAITQTFINDVEALVHQGSLYAIGEVWVVTDISHEKCYIQEDEPMGNMVTSTLDLASDMRRAYLAQQEQST